MPPPPPPPPLSAIAQVSPVPKTIKIRTAGGDSLNRGAELQPAERTIEVEPHDYAARLEQTIATEAEAWPITSRGAPQSAPVGLGLRGIIAIALIALILGAAFGSVVVILVLEDDSATVAVGHASHNNEPPTEPATPISPTIAPPLGTPPIPVTTSAPAAPPIQETPAVQETPPTAPPEPEQPSIATPETSNFPVTGVLPEGAPFPRELVLSIRFHEGSAQVESYDREQIQQIANRVQEDRSLRFRIWGYVSPEEDQGGHIAYRRAMVAVGVIARLGPSRRRFRAERTESPGPPGVHVMLFIR